LAGNLGLRNLRDKASHVLSEVRDLSNWALGARRASSGRQQQVRTRAAGGRLRPLTYGLQRVEQRPQFVAKVRELSTKVRHCHLQMRSFEYNAVDLPLTMRSCMGSTMADRVRETTNLGENDSILLERSGYLYG
jgi:hypothetical protein